jgi:hypothetical protein
MGGQRENVSGAMSNHIRALSIMRATDRTANCTADERPLRRAKTILKHQKCSRDRGEKRNPFRDSEIRASAP